MEYEALANSIYAEIFKCRYGDFIAAYTIAMGDCNLNIITPDVQAQIKNAYLDCEFVQQVGQKTVRKLTIQENLTALKDLL